MTSTAAWSVRSSTAGKSETRWWQHVDVSLIASTMTISLLGLLMVYSATEHKFGHGFAIRQALWVAIGVAVMAIVTTVDYRVFRDHSVLLYVMILLALLMVLSPLGSSSKGAQAWFQLGPFQIQPSEYAKVALIICLGAYCSTHEEEITGRRLVGILAFAGVPMALIYKQPDLGTALVFVAILMSMLLVAGARARHLAILMGIGVVAVVAVIQLGVLKQYQLDRLSAFLAPSGDTQRSAYNLNQSKIAIGSGGLTGRGLFKGTQTNLSYVPEQHTDFIFTVVGEELGLVGSSTLLALFAIVVWRMWRAAVLAQDLSGTLICVGVVAMFVFQVFENVGMTMGIMPITGIPLPFMSYGGSSTLTSFAAVGLVLNIHMRRFQ